MAEFSNDFLNKIFNHDLEDVAIICGNKYTYYDLKKEVNKKILELKNYNNIVGILGDFSFDNISLFLACIELKKIIVPFVNKEELNVKINEVGLDVLFDKGNFIKYKVEKNHTLLKLLLKENQSGLILFSSGSTGKPKAIVHSLDQLLNCIKFVNKNNIFILLFLFDHVAGIDVLVKGLSSHSTLVIPKNKNAEEILSLISEFKVNIMPVSPTMLKLIMFSDYNRYDLSSLEVIAYGSEKLDNVILNKLKLIFPKVYFKQNFGTSETFSLETRNHKNKEEYFKIINTCYKIINNELFIKSDTQSLGYLNADNSAFDNEGYFATGDLVEVIHENGEEYIKIIGRNKEIINVGGEKVLPQEVEGIILQIPFIQDCLVYSQKNPITGQSVCAKIVLEQGKTLNSLELKKEIRLFCKDKLANYKIPTKIEIVEKLEFSDRFKKVRR
ncbi:ANL family adenylate-forming protein [Campylobacter taeniopygiae]|uniref:ANL family adenylate-forming protein n=1 Tax=Campylobacter taeniopygiae TaxID=2510188 RepID=UPI003D6C24BB